jgi:hypothetical protein
VITRGVSYGVSVNAALRAALGLGLGEETPAQRPSKPRPSLHTTWRIGKLRPLLDAGLLHDGQPLTWYRRQRGETHTATVTAEGFLADAEGRHHLSPDQCATALSGYPCKGWKSWRIADGTTLDQLRNRLLAVRPRTTKPA